MYLHIGNGKSVRKKDIIGIFDLDTATVSKITRGFIGKMQKDGRLEYYDTDLPRAFVLIGGRRGSRLRLSRISPQGLKQRADGGAIEE
ncbi:MAG: DUF370 domain-containing protein [Clostridia bacterium]|nr:DUF370 domain-containing protein [Clostridia bacterium]